MSKKINKWLYKRGTKGKVRKWRVVVNADQFHTEQGLDEPGAKLTVNNPTTCKGKNLGKANETTPEDQAVKEAEAKYDKKLKESYFENKDNIDKGFKEPMLAKKFLDRKDKVEYPVAVECKLNGVRALYRERGKMVSRKNEEFHCVPHIIKLLDEYMPKGIQLDGEFFNDESREHLNRITKLVSVARTSPTPEELDASEKIVEYHVYDGYDFKDPTTRKLIKSTTPFSERRSALVSLLETAFNDYDSPKVVPVVYKTAHRFEDVLDYLDNMIDQKHEGAIIRVLGGEYEHKRSSNLLKLKNFEDAEFEVVRVEQGKGNWEGYVKRVVCQLPPELAEKAAKHYKNHDGTFASNIEGNQTYLKDLWENPGKIVGKTVTIRYQNLSEYGIPQIPYVTAIRDYE